MGFFRKSRTPQQLGGILYEALRSGLEGDGELSGRDFLEATDLWSEERSAALQGEMILGLMFAAMIAIERSASPRVAEQIAGGMKTEFLNHLEEQGASRIQRAEWEAVAASRLLQYRRSLEPSTSYEPPWRLGRAFYWNLLGREDQHVMPIKIATLYLMKGRDLSQDLLNEYGPSLIIDRGERTRGTPPDLDIR